MKKLSFLLLAFSLFTTINAQIVNIPDANFKGRLLSASTTITYAKNLAGNYFKIDANNDGQIQETEALQVSYLDASSSRSASLVGIEKFTNLKELYCNGNTLTSININDLSSLEILVCSANQLTTLNVSTLVKLSRLICGVNRLTSINVTGLTNLQWINCHSNKLTSLDLTSSTGLKKLVCFENQLNSLNVNGLINLEEIDCFSNNLSSLDLTGFINLTKLNCYSNKLTSLNVTGLTNISLINCYSNNLSSLDVTSCSNLKELNCYSNQLISLNVKGLTSIQILQCYKNQITSIDVSSLVNLTSLYCNDNQLTSLDVSSLVKLSSLSCENNILTTLDVTILPMLGYVNCANNQISTLDVSKSVFEGVVCFNNKLETLFIKNGSREYIVFSGNPTLKYICADEAELMSIQNEVTSLGYTNCSVSSYCSLVPGGTFYTIQGNQKLDTNNNGCDVNDIPISNFKYTITNGSITGSIISDTSGNYTIPVQAGTHTITPKLENPTYFTVSPTTVNITFPTQMSPFSQNFCITPNGVRPDLEVTLLPLQPARPGFDAKYKLVYKNKGNTIQSGSVNLNFNDAVLDLVVANPVVSSQTTNNLSWSFTNLQPFETREITFSMNVNSPMETPAVNNGDILNFGTTITSSATDETPTDNTFTFNQTVVGSYDPNDKTCLEGSVITPALIGQYVHYTIRFEITGTFAAENVVVKDMIDLAKFDISTLVPTSASHSYITRISAGNKVEFIFENINLPFDDANNDGFIAFKIKTKPTLVVNDTFSNEANIYFDYNFPILTNKATSTFKTLGTQDFDFTRYFTLYPNPAKADLNISTKESINTQSMSVYNTLGQLVLALPNAAKVSTIDVSSLTAGNYFLQIKTDKGSSSSRFVKE